MKWDTDRRRYVDESGRVMREAEVRQHIDEFIVHEQKEVERQTEKLFIGALTLPAFFEFLRHKITSWHSVAGSTAYGGPDQMSGEQWSRVNSKILSELEFLAGFQREAETSFAVAESIAADVVRSLEIPAGLESLVQERVTEALVRAAPSEAATVGRQAVAESLADSGASEVAASIQSVNADGLIGGTIPNRSKMYADAAYATYENNVSGRESDAGAMGVRRVSEEDDDSCEECPDLAVDDYVLFEEIRDIGDTPCGGRCRCFFEFSYEGIEPLTVDRRLTS